MADKVCSKENCDRKHYAKGLCKSHYTTMMREASGARRRACGADGCDRIAWSGRFCSTHYARRREGRMDVPIRRHRTDGCGVEGCVEPHYGGGMCKSHYVPARKLAAADDALKLKYDIGIGQRQELIDSQGGVCAICGEPPRGGKLLVVDHDHSHCGGPRKACRWCVRGMLCTRCNVHLARVEDFGWLEKAIRYLSAPPAYEIIPRPDPGRKPGRPFADVEQILKDLGIRPKGIVR